MNPLKLAILALLLLPIAEIYVLIHVGGLLGFLPTILLLGCAALTGTYLLQTQGLKTFGRIQQSLDAGRLPAQDMIEGGLIFAAGILLLIPGFISDGMSLFLLLPASRRWLAGYLVDHALQGLQSPDSGSRTIEGQCRRED
ncbi:FxsA family protein [Methylococcus geothermalis]|uniref:FxsA family protein n=1 Tax=Methylococcus geothermalis TaxID=2681310 RepID=A0A858QA58_9GAMM|nr:FxsA family protein [Methylococcus geothermalis]QJD30759.1 FxsA family protein [Methylococcus geothermalis]